MREILFRGKKTNNEEWVYGFYQEYPKGYVHIQNDSNDWFPVIPKTVCQYTDLIDKNGRKIFEGDIVKHDMSDTIGVVKWYCEDYVGWCVDDIHIGEQQFTDEMWNECEVIGNIFDNPELIGE